MFLGIDVGTGSSKAVLVDLDGTVLDSSSRPHEISMPRPNWAEFDATEAWEEVTSMCRELLDRNDASKISGLGVSAMGPCLIVTDKDLNPLRPTILYGIDARAEDEIAELNDLFGKELIYSECGKSLSSQSAGPKLRWIRNHEPEVFAASERLFSLSSWLVAKFTGQYILDHHTASQFDPLYDVATFDWNDERSSAVLEHLPAPALAWSADVVGGVTPQAAEVSHLPEGTPVCAGTVDAWAEALSAGVRQPGDLMLMYGSTMFFVQVLHRLASHPQLWTTAGVDPGSYTLAAGMSTSGSLTSWVQDLVGGVPFDDLVREAAAVPAGSDGLLLLPYFAGERTPIFDARARGVIAGLSLRHTRAHLFRAVYEGIAFGIRQILELLDGNIDAVERLVAVGGGTQGGLWTQIVSDVTGREQQVPAETIGAAYGDALMAAIGVGLVPPETDWAVPGQTVKPNPATHEVYDVLYQSYCELYPATKAFVHQLAQLQEEHAVTVQNKIR